MIQWMQYDLDVVDVKCDVE